MQQWERRGDGGKANIRACDTGLSESILCTEMARAEKSREMPAYNDEPSSPKSERQINGRYQ